MNLYHLYCTRDAANLTRDCYERGASTWLCPGCKCVKPKLSLPIVELSYVPKFPLNIIAGAGIGLISVDFINVLGQREVDAALSLGEAYDSKGKRLSNLRTYRGNSTLFLRGNRKSQYRSCDECGRFLYHPSGELYVTSKSLTDKSIYNSQLQLLVDYALYKHIQLKKWKGLGIHKLPVVDKSEDGLDAVFTKYGPHV